jgi:3-isopropylmalate/(R)-2-methylmalate dehydratase small subunit
MALKFKGKVWVFGDNLDTDNAIIPFRKVDSGEIKPGEYGKWVMTNLDPDFPKKVKKGDFVVVGSNMGCGHGHSQANMAIIQCGISVVIAESFDRNFFRNSIHLGLPIIECKGITQKVKEGDEIEVDFSTGKIKNFTTGAIINFNSFPDFLLDMIEVGGLEPYTNKLIAERKV